MRELEHVLTSDQLMAHTWTLDQLIAGARAGKDAHVGELYRRFGDRVHARLYRISPRLADEVLDDTFMALPTKLEGYREAGKFDAWLMRVAVNLLRTRRRSEVRLRETTGSSDLRGLGGGRVPGSFERREIIQRLLECLPNDQRLVWEQLEQGYSPAEVADALGTTVTNVYQLKCRAKQQLRRAAREMLEW